MNVLFKVEKEEQIETMLKSLNGKDFFGDNVFVSNVNSGDYDLVINVSPELKAKAKIFDHSGTVYRLGMPCDIEYDELINKNDGLQEQKRKQREKERKEKLPKKCPKCDYMKPAGQYVCAKCGFKPISGEDVEADTTRDLEVIKGKKKEFTKEEKQAFYSELWGWRANKKIYNGKEYSEGYIAHLYKSKFGVFPKGLSRNPKEPTPTTTNYIRSRQIAFAKSKQKASQ